MTCPDCDEPMTAELLRPDPHEPPAFMLLCPCGHSEPAPMDIEADLQDRPRLPGF
jgi:hypothetical protein